MPYQIPKAGDLFYSTRNISLIDNIHISILSSSSPKVLPENSEAIIINSSQSHFELDCKDSSGWGLRMRIAKAIFGETFAPK